MSPRAPACSFFDAFLRSARDAAATEGFRFLGGDDSEGRFVSFEQLAADAAGTAAALASYASGPRDRVVLLLTDATEFTLGFLGAVHAGLIPVPAAPPFSLSGLETYIEHLRHIIERSGATVLIAAPELKPLLGSLLRPPLRKIITMGELERGPGTEAWPARASDTLFIQFTSGSTAQPKGVAVTNEMLLANAHCILRTGLDKQPEDAGCSWLPLYHDMGLIGFVLAPLISRTSVVFLPPLAFLKNPIKWFRAITRYRSSITFAPNFAFGLSTKRIRDRDLEGIDLSSLRIVGCGAEPIQAPVLERFASRFSSVGFSSSAFLPCYGLAESTLAVSFVDVDSGLRCHSVRRDVLVDEGRAVAADANTPDGLDLVCCGRPFPEHALRVVRADGSDCEDSEVGSIEISGPSVMTGYFDDEEATAAAISDGWLRTGDLGYLHNGELYICGREKDLIIVAGRNYYPNDIEWLVSSVAAVRTGNVAAFGLFEPGVGDEQVVVCAEVRPGADHAEIEQSIRKEVLTALGLRVSAVELLQPGVLPKTTSGKIARARTRTLYRAGGFAKSSAAAGFGAVATLAKSQLHFLRNRIGQ